MIDNTVSNDISYGTFVPVIVAAYDNGLYEPEIVDYEFVPVVDL